MTILRDALAFARLAAWVLLDLVRQSRPEFRLPDEVG